MKKVAQLNDAELLEQLVKRDQQAFTTLYNHYHNGIYNFLLGVVKIPAMAEDLLQDVFLKVWENAPSIRVSASLSAYLYQMARNKAIDTLRRIARDPLLEEEVRHRLISGVYKFSYEEHEWKQYENLLNKALSAMPPQRKKVFELIRKEGMKYDEAAALMGISRNTLKQHLSLAVEAIRKYLLENGDIILVLTFYWQFHLL